MGTLQQMSARTVSCTSGRRWTRSSSAMFVYDRSVIGCWIYMRIRQKLESNNFETYRLSSS